MKKTIASLIKNNSLIILLLIFPAIYFLLKPGVYWNMHDDMQMIRQLEFEKCLYDGQIPCRWTPDLSYGYGLPLFNYYPPLPYIIGQIYRIAGFSFVNTIKLVAATQFILSAVFMYLLVKNITNKYAATVAAVFYTYAPYHAVNIYVRGAMNEAWASVFFPLTFLISKKLIETNKVKYIFLLAISFALILLSHNPMALIFFPSLFLWSLYWIYYCHQYSFSKWLVITKQFAISGLISLGLSAFFTLPSIFETSLVQIDKMFSGYYSYSNHFVSLFQLFISNFWGDGASIWGPNDGMSFSIGHVHWILPLITISIITFKYLKKKKSSNIMILMILVYIFALANTFMAHERSTFIWKAFPTIQKVQFPWRFLNTATFLFSLASGFAISVINKNKVKAVTVLIVVITVILNFRHFYPITSGPISDQEKFSGKAWENQISGGIYDYLPKGIETVATKVANDYVDQVSPKDSPYSMTGQKRGTDWQLFNLTLSQKTIVTLPILNFPNFVIKVNGEKIDFSSDPETGRISLDLTPGEHQIYVKLKNSTIREISNYISIFTWLICFSYIFRPIWKKLTLAK